MHHTDSIGAPRVIKSKGRVNTLVHHTAQSTTTKTPPTLLAPSTVFKLVIRESQSGSAVSFPSVPSSTRPSKDLVAKCSLTPYNAQKTLRPSSSTPTRPLPLAAPSTTSSHLCPAYMHPDTTFFPSYPLHAAIVSTPPSALSQHPGSPLPKVGHQSPGMLPSKGAEESVSATATATATATAARDTADQTIRRTNITPPNSLVGAKRRLGMGHSGAGYVSKRQKITD